MCLRVTGCFPSQDYSYLPLLLSLLVPSTLPSCLSLHLSPSLPQFSWSSPPPSSSLMRPPSPSPTSPIPFPSLGRLPCRPAYPRGGGKGGVHEVGVGGDGGGGCRTLLIPPGNCKEGLPLPCTAALLLENRDVFSSSSVRVPERLLLWILFQLSLR